MSQINHKKLNHRTKTHLTIATQNMGGASFGRGIYKREPLLAELIDRKCTDVLFLTECDVENYQPYGSLKIDGMLMYASRPAFVQTKNKAGKGTAKKEKKVRTIALVRPSSFKHVVEITQGTGERAEVWLKCTTAGGETFVLGGVYQEWIHPGRCAGRDNDGLIKLLQKFAMEQTAVLGDWNHCAEKGGKADHIEATKTMGYKVAHDGYTFLRQNKDREPTRSTLDWRLSNIENLKPVKKTWEGVSDHAWVQYELPVKIEKDPTWFTRRSKKHLFTTESIDTLKEELSTKTAGMSELHDLTRVLVDTTRGHLDKFAPELRFSSGEAGKKKENPRLKQLRRAMKRAKKAGRTKSYHRNQKRYRDEILKSKRDDIKQEVEKKGIQSVWKIRKSKTEPPRQSIKIKSSTTGKLQTDKETADGFMRTFIQKVQEAKPEEYVPCQQANKSECRSPKSSAIPTDYFVPRRLATLEEKTEEQVEKMVASMKNSEATDSTGLSQRDFKGLCKGLISPLTKMLNESMRTQTFPDEYKTAKIKPLLKTGQPPDSYRSYRPISLLSPFGKLIELTIKDVVLEFAVEHNLIPRAQHGYQAGKSVTSAISEALKEIDMQKQKNMKTAVVLFDFSCAFDLVDVDRLMNRMLDLGFGRELRNWIQSYLTSRKAYVEVNGKMSEVVTLEFGTPQGSIISPLLFLILISDMGAKFDGLLVGYADDSTNIVSAKTVDELHEKIKQSIEKMTDYANRTGMCINIKKTEFLHFGKTKLPPVKVGNVTLHEQTEVKFLGSYLNKAQTSTSNLNHLTAKVNREAAALTRVCHTLPLEARKTLANGIIWPMIVNSIETWTNPLKFQGDRTLKKLQRLWNTVSRMVLRVRLSDRLSTEEIMARMGSRTVRREALVGHARLLHDTLIADSKIRYLGTYDGDERAARRPQRRSALQVTGGRSPVDRCRRLLNALHRMKLENIISEDKETFMTLFVANLETIEENLEKETE